MDETKPWWQSKTIWGSVVMVIAVVAQFFNVSIDDAARSEIVEILSSLGGVVGAALAVFGRITATAKLK